MLPTDLPGGHGHRSRRSLRQDDGGRTKRAVPRRRPEASSLRPRTDAKQYQHPGGCQNSAASASKGAEPTVMPMYVAVIVSRASTATWVVNGFGGGNLHGASSQGGAAPSISASPTFRDFGSQNSS